MSVEIQTRLQPISVNVQPTPAKSDIKDFDILAKEVVQNVLKYVYVGVSTKKPLTGNRIREIPLTDKKGTTIYYLNAEKIMSQLDMTGIASKREKIKADPIRSACLDYLVAKVAELTKKIPFTHIQFIEHPLQNIHQSSLILKAVITKMDELEADSNVYFKDCKMWALKV